MGDDRAKQLEQENLVPVFEADDESTAVIITGLLEGEGIPSIVHVHEPMLEAPLTEDPGIWGEIMVGEPDAGRARDVIEGYRQGRTVETSG